MAKMKRRNFYFFRITFENEKKRMKKSLPSNLCDIYTYEFIKREDEDDLAI